jgi:stage III sporulation protein AB
MVRLVGFSMIGLSCSGLGLWYAWNLRQRLYHLHAMNRIIELLVSLLQYGKSTLPECCCQLAGQVEEPYRQAFTRVYREMAEGRGHSFTEVYERVMGEALRELPLKEQDRQLFLQCVLEQGSGDGQARVRLIRRQQELLRERIARLEAESREKGRMAVGLGTLGGLLLIIILL